MSYVRAVYDFQTVEGGEIPLRHGDVALLLYDVDENWACGKFYGQVGTFPKAFVESVPVPQAQHGQKVFAAVKDFAGEVEGDLAFQRGDVILGLKQIDNNWYHGQRCDHVGMFPVTHVRELDVAPPAADEPPSGQQALCGQQVLHGQHSTNTPTAAAQYASTPKQNESACSISAGFVARAVASTDISAQIDEELGFSKGDVVNIIQALDSDFAMGECNGKTGMFPLAFVEIFEGQINTVHEKSPREKRKSKFRWWEEESSGNEYSNQNVQNGSQWDQSSDQNVQPVVQSRGGVHDVKTVAESNLHSYESTHSDLPNESAPPYHMTSQAGSHDTYGYTVNNTTSHDAGGKTHRRTGSYTQENTRSHDSSIMPYGRTLFPFIAENANELTFIDNEIVTLIQHIDEQWVEGEIDGRCGIFPTSYVEIIVDCPWSENTPAADDLPGAEKRESDISKTSDVMPNTNDAPVLSGPPIEMEQIGDVSSDMHTSSLSGHCPEPADKSQNQGNQAQIGSAEKTEQVNNYSLPNKEIKSETNMQRHNNLHFSDLNSETAENANAQITSNCFGLVLYDYKPDDVSEVSFLEGDTVTILQQVDIDWFAVEGEGGQRGFCPISYVDVLCLCPIPKSPIALAAESYMLKTESESQVVECAKTTSPLSNHVTPTGDDESSRSEKNTAIVNRESVPSKPIVTKPKPTLKPKPSIKPKPATQKTEKKKEPDVLIGPKPDNIAQSSSNRDSISSSQSDISTLENKSCDFQRSEQVSSSGDKSSSRGGKVAPKRPTNVPKVSVFAANSSIKTSNNLDDIIANQMSIAKKEAETRARASSVNSDTGKAPPPIPERKNIPNTSQLNRSQSAEFKTKPSVPTRKQVAFSVFYTSDDDFGTKRQSATPQQRKVPARPAGPPQVPGATGEATGTPQHVTPVPRRPAPPRPGAMNTGSNLIEFSPEKERSDSGLDSECAEIVADLDKRIAETEADLRRYEVEKEQLQAEWMKESAGVCAENAEDAETESKKEKSALKEQIGFTEANIKGLTEELNSLKESLYQFKPERMQADLELQRKAEQQKQLIEEQRRREEEEKRHREEVIAKHKETRMRVIQEILQTEKDYLHSISLCYDVFSNSDPQRPARVDMDLLFGNIDQVVALSQRLLTALEEATQGKDFDQQVIGRCFVELKNDMTQVYAPYCRNHDDVITLLEKYEESSEIQDYFNKKVEVMRESGAVFDLGSVLIKPVQRILKYPLLLNELIKNTEEDHVDKAELASAMNVMTQVAAAINEYKRRKDLVRKYKAVKEEGIGEKFSKFNVHSTKKKFARLSQKMVGPLTVDEDFNREERKYKSLESAIRLLTRDLTAYMDQVQDVGYCLETVANDLYDYYDDQSQQPKIQQYCQCTNEIATKLFAKYKQQVELQVLHPLSRLLILYQAPNKVIKKRHDKLLDYDNLMGKGSGGGQEVQKAKNNYEALNAQLLDELPQLYQLSTGLIRECLGRLVRAQKRFYIACVEQLYTLPDEFLMSLDHESMDSFNAFHQKAVDKLSQLIFIPKTFNPNIDEKRVTVRDRKASETQEPEWSSSQTSAMRAQLRSNYGNDKVRIVTSDYASKGMVELTLSKGTLVGVIKERDPMGNTDRWYVDNGVNKGIFPTSHLGPAPPSVTSSPQRSESANSNADNLLGLEGTAKPGLSPAVSAFDHPTLFDAVCSPTFGQILQPQPVSQSNALVQAESQVNQSYTVINQSPISQSTASVMRPFAASNQSDSSIHLSPNKAESLDQSDSSVQSRSSAIDALIESEDMSDLYDEGEWYQAVYAFVARTKIEINLQEGQVCKVIDTHDLEGNSEWWLVEADGIKGYAPANYLQAL